MNYNIVKDLLYKGYKLKKYNWSKDTFLSLDENSSVVLNKSENYKLKFLPGIEDLKSNDWTIKYD